MIRGIALDGDYDKLIVRATAAEVAAVRRGAQVTIHQAAQHETYVVPGETLYNAVGDAVALVREISTQIEMYETTVFGDAFSHIGGGIVHARITAEGFYRGYR